MDYLLISDHDNHVKGDVAHNTYYLVHVEGSPTPYPEVPGATARSGNRVGLSNPIYFNFDPSF